MAEDQGVFVQIVFIFKRFVYSEKNFKQQLKQRRCYYVQGQHSDKLR